MRFHPILAVAFTAVFGFAPAALANGAISEFPAGGVVFKPEKDISIAREELEIGWNLIRVRYVFMSSASQPIDRTIGFPMARVSLEDGPDNIGNTTRAEDGGDPRNYMAFKVAVNGEPLTPKLHEYAWSGDSNVTSKLIDMGIPLFARDTETFIELAQLPEATVAELRRENLVSENEPDYWLVPQWEYQTVYEWTQTFAPGKTEVEISYRPLFGASNDYHYYYGGGGGASQYCLGDAVSGKFADSSPQPFTVGYILQTARNWHGPIGEFRLTVSDGRGSLFSFCVPDGLRAVGDGDSWEAKNFTPRSDLKIVFYLQDG